MDVVPPLLKSLMTSRSPGLCTPMKPVPPPTAVAAERDLVLEEPEALRRVTAVVVAVRAEEQDLARTAKASRSDDAIPIQVAGAVRTVPARLVPGSE